MHFLITASKSYLDDIYMYMSMHGCMRKCVYILVHVCARMHPVHVYVDARQNAEAWIVASF